jgi:dTDP-4-dehydrorhamnose 3,5-epimerase-like enzyme
VQIRELDIPDAYVVTSKQFGDDRGVVNGDLSRFDDLRLYYAELDAAFQASGSVAS